MPSYIKQIIAPNNNAIFTVFFIFKVQEKSPCRYFAIIAPIKKRVQQWKLRRMLVISTLEPNKYKNKVDEKIKTKSQNKESLSFFRINKKISKGNIIEILISCTRDHITLLQASVLYCPMNKRCSINKEGVSGPVQDLLNQSVIKGKSIWLKSILVNIAMLIATIYGK